MDWQPIETAPKDGTKIWGWLYDEGIHLVHWMSAEANAAADGGDPLEYIACWVKSGDPDDGEWHPRFWKPFDAINVPAGVVLVGAGWRDEAAHYARKRDSE